MLPGSVESKVTRTGAKGRMAAADAPRARRARAMSDLLPAAGGAAFRRFGFVQSSIVSRWQEIVGARYAAVSAPESIRFPVGKKSNGTLTLVVEGAHAPMMQHVAPTIQERVNQFFGYEAVAKVAIRQGLVQVEKRKSRAAPPSLRPVTLPVDMKDSLRDIADPELRLCLESLARGLTAGDAAPPVTTIPVVGRIGERKK
jgi:hypothetical protein